MSKNFFIFFQVLDFFVLLKTGRNVTNIGFVFATSFYIRPKNFPVYGTNSFTVIALILNNTFKNLKKNLINSYEFGSH